MANFTGNQIRHTYQRVVQIDPQSTGSRGTLQDGFGNPIDASIKSLTVSESLAVTSSVSIGSDLGVSGDGTILGDLIVGGTVTAQEFFSEYVSSSVIYESGSTKFGDSLDDTHIRTGSVSINGNITSTGSLNISGSSSIEGTLEIKEGSYGAFFANPQTLERSVSIPTNYNSRMFGPITVAAGKILTVGANAKLEIIDI